jgi:hypothetical protein
VTVSTDACAAGGRIAESGNENSAPERRRTAINRLLAALRSGALAIMFISLRILLSLGCRRPA